MRYDLSPEQRRDIKSTERAVKFHAEKALEPGDESAIASLLIGDFLSEKYKAALGRYIYSTALRGQLEMVKHIQHESREEDEVDSMIKTYDRAMNPRPSAGPGTGKINYAND